jgi:hypothetical protein
MRSAAGPLGGGLIRPLRIHGVSRTVHVRRLAGVSHRQS